MVIAALVSRSLSLPQWHCRLPLDAQTASIKRCFNRWLHDTSLIHTGHTRVFSVTPCGTELDIPYYWLLVLLCCGTTCGGIRISMIYMGRALPVAWRVIEHKSSFIALFFRCLLLIRRAFGTGPLLNATECSRDFSCRQGIREPATDAQSFTVWLETAYSHQKQSGSTTVPLYPRRILSVTQPHAASFFKVLYTFLLRRLRYNAFMAFMSSIYILRTQPSGREMI